MEKLIVIGPASQILGIKVANEMNLDYLTTEFKTFGDGENYLRIDVEDESLIKGKEIIIIQSTGPSISTDQNGRLFELMMMIAAIKRMGASKIIVVIPYLAYARQDKIFRPGETDFARQLIQILDSLKIDELYVVDVHAPDVLKEASFESTNIDSMGLLAEHIQSLGTEDIVVISPDKGAVERSKAFAKHFGENVPVDFFEKKRDVKTGDITMSGALSLKDKDVVVSDDIIATGGTMANAIKLAKQGGAKKVYAVATHALLLQQAKFRIYSAGADVIIGTDSIDNEAAIVSLAPIIAKYLK